MKYAIQHRCALATLISLLSVACESEERREPTSQVAPSDAAAQQREGLNVAPPPMSDGDRAELERESARVRCRETTSPSELSISWEKTPETSQSELRAIVKNNGSATVRAEPVLIAANPSLGESRERRLGSVTVAPGAETTIVVNVADFPVQSLGEASSVSIGLRWKRQKMQEEMSHPQALSQPLFVTHDDESFRSAVLRDYESELGQQLTLASRVKALGSQPMERRLRRALVAGSKELRVIERVDVPTLATGAPALSTTNIDVRQP